MKRIKINGLSLIIFGLLITQTFAKIPLGARLAQTIEWHSIKLPEGASLLENDAKNGNTIIVKSDKTERLNVPLLRLEDVKVRSKWYAVRGSIRYRDVAEASYLETWNEFLPSQPGSKNVRSFSRTLAEVGPLAKIVETSDWRPFFIPFDGSAAIGPPLKIDLNLVLNGKGEVAISDLEVLEFSNADLMWSGMLSLPEAPRLSWLKIGTFAVLGALTLVITIVFVIKRNARKAEVRRMKAMDTL